LIRSWKGNTSPPLCRIMGPDEPRKKNSSKARQRSTARKEEKGDAHFRKIEQPLLPKPRCLGEDLGGSARVVGNDPSRGKRRDARKPP